MIGKKVGFNSGRKPRTKSKFRTCEKSNCSTPLSIYNKKKNCFIHTPVSYPRVRGHIDRLQGEK